MFPRSPLFFSICLNILFLLLYIAFGIIRHGSLDDYFMSSVLTGAYGGEYDVHMYFINSAYGYFLKPFYWLFPKVGWYFIFELVGTFAAFTVYSYFFIRQQGYKWGIALSAFFLAALTPDFYFQLSFTQCATSYTAAGLLFLFFGVQEIKRRFLVLGILFLVAGSVMRFEGFLLGMPYMFFLLIVLCRTPQKFTKNTLIALCLFFAAVYGLRMFDKSLYVDSDYKFYAEYQPIRAYFGDGAFYDRETAYDELEERGMSGPDFYRLKAWMFYDTDVFSKDSLEKIRDVVQNNLFDVNCFRFPIAFFLAVSGAFARNDGACWIVLCFLLMLSKSKKAAFFPWISLFIIALSIGYLLLVNRLAYHVETGIWLYAVVMSIPMLPNISLKTKNVSSKWKRLLLAFLVIGTVFGAQVGISEQIHLKTEKKVISTVKTPNGWNQFLAYAQKNKDKVFILSFERYKEMGELRNPPYIAIGPGDFDNIYSWGYWNIYLPTMKKELAKRGVHNPIRDIVHDNVYLLEDGNRPSLDEFFKEHYHKSLIIDTANVFEDLILLKYRLLERLEGTHNE